MDKVKYILLIFLIFILTFSFNAFAIGFFKIQEPVYVNPINVGKLVTASPPLKPLPGIAIKKEDLPIKIDIPSTSFLNIWLDRAPGAVYMPGEEMTVYFMVKRDSYVLIYDIDANGKARLIFPNMYIRDNFLKAGNVYAIPLPNWFKLRVTPPLGKEYLQGFASARGNLLSAKEKRLIKTGVVPVTDVRVLTRKFNLLLDPMNEKDWSSAVVYFQVGLPQNMPKENVKTVVPAPSPQKIGTQTTQGAPVIVITPTMQGTQQNGFTQIPEPLGGISISSIPQGANVFLDGMRKGITPITLENIKAGAHKIKIELGGYETLEENVYVPEGKITSVVYSLVPVKKVGYVFIIDAVKGAKVYVDGKYKGHIPQSGNLKIALKPGYHNITLMKEGYNTWTRGVNISAEQTVYIFPNS